MGPLTERLTARRRAEQDLAAVRARLRNAEAFGYLADAAAVAELERRRGELERQLLRRAS